MTQPHNAPAPNHHPTRVQRRAPNEAHENSRQRGDEPGSGPGRQRLWVGHGTPSATGTTGCSAGTPTAGGTLSILSGTATEHWDPQRVYVGVNIESGNRLFTRTLTTFGPVAKDGDQATLVADAATDTGTVERRTARTWKFTIKDGIKWEDGKAVTCEDFKYGISRTFAVDVITGGPNYAIAVPRHPEERATARSKYAGPYKKTGQDLYDKAVTC